MYKPNSFTLTARRRSHRGSDDQSGFTLIELLVVIIILGILSAVVVFAVRGTGDKGKSAADLTDAKTVRTAQEAYCANKGRYGSMQELVDEKFLSDKSTITDTAPVAGGACTGSGDLSKTGFILGFAAPNGGSPAKIDKLTMTLTGAAAGGGNGFPTPFQYVRGPGHINTNYMFDPLIWKDATGQLIPWLATAVPSVANGGITNAGKTYTFTLRSGVKWHDNIDFTANDVKFSFDYRKTGSASGAGIDPCTCKSAFGFIDSVSVDPVDPLKVSFNLNTAIPNTFLDRIGAGMVIIPQHIWEPITSPKTQNKNPAAYIGTGPYKLANPTSYDPTTAKAQYDANTAFFLGVPYVRQLQILPVGTDPVASLANGTADAAGPGVEEFFTQDLGPVSGLPRVTSPGGFTRVLHFQNAKGFPYNSVKFRQAVANTVDRKGLVQSILGGQGQPGSTGALAPSHPLLTPGLPAYDRDVAKGKALLDQLGIVDTNADGKRECPESNPCNLVNADNTVTTSVTPANFTPNLYTSTQFSNAPVTAIKQYLLDIGLDSTLTAEAGATADARATNGNYGLQVNGWGNVTADADQLRTRLQDSFTSTAAGKNFTAVYGWNDAASQPTTTSGFATNAAEFQALATQQLFEADPAIRKTKVQRMQQLVAADVPILELYVPDAVLIYRSGTLSAWYSTPGGTPPGPPGYNNKHVFVTGKQFGLPAGY